MIEKMLAAAALALAGLSLLAVEPRARLDVFSGKVELQPASTPEGGECVNAPWIREAGKKSLYLFSQGAELKEEGWRDFQVSFLPKADGEAVLALKGVFNGKDPVWVCWDDITVEGAELVNGDFEKTAPDGKPAGWNLRKEQYLSRDGRKYVTVWFDGPATQTIKVAGNRKVTVKARVKRADSQVVDVLAVAGALRSAGQTGPVRAVTLTGVAQPPPIAASRLPNQLNCDSEIRPLKFRRSDEIAAGNIFGVALGEDGKYLHRYGSKDEDAQYSWSPGWLVSGRTRNIPDFRGIVYSSDQNNFSSAAHRQGQLAKKDYEWVEIALRENREIGKIRLLPRDGKNSGFPHDFQVLTSENGVDWTVAADEKDYPLDPKNPPVYKFPPRRMRFIKVVATKLRMEIPKVFYFQLGKVEAYGPDGVNYALDTEGATATARRPMEGEDFNYRQYYGQIFDAGIKWVFVNDWMRDRKESDWQALPTLVENLNYLNANGVQVIYRFNGIREKDLLLEDASQAAADFADRLTPVVKALKGRVAIWALGNEENFYAQTASSVAAKFADRFRAESYKRSYVRHIRAGAERIRQLDPGTPIEIESALFDFGWTGDILKMGLADQIDFFSVHAYKEAPREVCRPEMAATFVRDGKRCWPTEQPYADYRGEIEAFQKLLHSYNPNLKMNCTETGVLIDAEDSWGMMTVSETSQAKMLARQYLFHCFFGVGPTCYWTLDRTEWGDGSSWGLLNEFGRGRDALKALRNVAAVMDNSFKPAPEIKLETSVPVEEFTWAAFRNPEGEILIPCWSAVAPRDANTGRVADFKISGVEIADAAAADMLGGTEHALAFERKGDAYHFKNMIVRDYPVVIRLNQRKEPPSTAEGKSFSEQNISKSGKI